MEKTRIRDKQPESLTLLASLVNLVYRVALPLVHRDGEGDLSSGAGHVPPLSHHHGAAQVPRRPSGKFVSQNSY
jgi:hypothetical protein